MNNNKDNNIKRNKDQSIEEHLEDDLEEFACVVNCDSEMSLLTDLTRDANWFKMIAMIATAETLVAGSYFVKPEIAYRSLAITATAALAAGLFLYSAYQSCILSENVGKLEKELQKEEIKTD